MNNESFSYDLSIGIFVYIVFSIYFLVYSIKDKHIKLIFFAQVFFLFMLLLITHFFAFNNYVTYPGLGADSMNYDIWAKYLSEQFKEGIFNLDLSNIYSMSLIEYNRGADIHLVSYVPYGFVLPHSIIYYIFGYKPFLAKVFNVFIFVYTTKLFYLFLKDIINNSKAIKSSLALFAFCFPLMIGSVSFVKEGLFMFGYIGLIRYTYRKEFLNAVPYFILAVLIRPYTPLLYIIIFGIYYRNYVLKNFIKVVFGLIFFLIFFTIFSFRAFNLSDFIFNSQFAIYLNPFNKEEVVYVKGVFGILRVLLSSPIDFIQFFINAYITAFFKPDFWHLPDFKYSSIYLNSGKFDFSGLFYYMHSFTIYYINFYLIKFLVNRKKLRIISINFEWTAVIFIIFGVIFLASVEIRYLVMSIFPIILVMFAKIKEHSYKIDSNLAFSIYLGVVSFLIIFPLFI
tara:strand:- start:22091 stop:23449 length:1359 start_codon:yes stop_codon:yes gene_type:complete